jgi:nicotinate phosphoribosyltransferase
LLAAGAPIDAFGVGTSAVVSSDAPALDSVYKLVAYAGKSRLKLSADKATLPGKKQVFRRLAGDFMAEDVIGLADEAIEGTPLLPDVMVDGHRTQAGRRTLAEVRDYTRQQVERLPLALRGLTPALQPYPVLLSDGLEHERQRASTEVTL